MIFRNEWKYIISYALVLIAFVVAFFSVFYMYSASVSWNTVQIMICCAVIAVTATYSGLLYSIEIYKRNEAEKKKPLSDKTQKFNSIKTVKSGK